MTDVRTHARTHGRTTLVVKSLSRLKIQEMLGTMLNQNISQTHLFINVQLVIKLLELEIPISGIDILTTNNRTIQIHLFVNYMTT